MRKKINVTSEIKPLKKVLLHRPGNELLNLTPDTLEELLTIVRNEKGRIEAPEGGHDDQMMGLAIAYEIRNQVTFIQEVMTPYPEFKEWDIDVFSKDYGEKLTIV